MKLVSNSAGTSLHLVLLRLQHSQPIVYHSQLLSAVHAKLQSNQPATLLAAEFDGSTCEQTVCPSADLCKHARDVYESVLDTPCVPYTRCKVCLQ